MHTIASSRAMPTRSSPARFLPHFSPHFSLHFLPRFLPRFLPSFLLRLRLPLPLRLLLAAPLLCTLHVSAAAPPAPARVTAATTLDVCQDDSSGSWRYSGAVAVRNGAATDTSVVRIGYWIQNRVSGIAYLDAFEALPVSGATDPAPAPRAMPAKVATYSVDGPPLLLGSIRNIARVRVYDALNAAAPVQSADPVHEVTAAICGCAAPRGCVRDQGYWGNRPNVAWPSPHSRSAAFFASGLTWQQVLDTPAGADNAYLILAHHYIAAMLNKAKGASVPAGVQATLGSAATWLASGVNLDSCGATGCETQKAWAGILDSYDHGEYPGAPKRCPN